jgi:hypothetical protein
LDLSNIDLYNANTSCFIYTPYVPMYGSTLVVSYSEHVCFDLRFMATHVKSSSLSQEEGVNDPLLKMFRRKKSLSRWVQAYRVLAGLFG